MSGDADKVKGRVKQAAGDLTDDDKLKREGKVDEEVGDAKGKAGKVIDAIGDKAKDIAKALDRDEKSK